MTAYITCTSDEIPAGLRWDVPSRNQGQIIEVAYADFPPWPSEAGPGDPYRRTIDGSDGSVTYERREDVAPARWVVLHHGPHDGSHPALADFNTRSEAERYSMSWHGCDGAMQFVGGHYVDATGRRWSEREALAALREAVRRG